MGVNLGAWGSYALDLQLNIEVDHLLCLLPFLVHLHLFRLLERIFSAWQRLVLQEMQSVLMLILVHQALQMLD